LGGRGTSLQVTTFSGKVLIHTRRKAYSSATSSTLREWALQSRAKWRRQIGGTLREDEAINCGAKAENGEEK